MKWIDRQRIFTPEDHTDWAGTHAQVPTVLAYPDFIRIYYADREPSGRSFTTFLDVDRRDPCKVLRFHKERVIDYGAPGTFDDDGIMPGFALRHDGRVWMYYNGWNRGVTVPYRNSIGLAVSDDDGLTFKRAFEGPILDRNRNEPYIAVLPTVLIEGSLWRMWYVSGTRWVRVGDQYEPVYVIKYCYSRDGIEWTRPNHLCIPPRDKEEALSHPTVLKVDDTYRMWFCYRSSREFRDGPGAYRIGYAESPDGLTWNRMDDAHGLEPSASGWDSTMTAYPYAIEVDQRILVFYNGNGFGRTGLGYATFGRTF